MTFSMEVSDDTLRFREMQSFGDIFISSCNKATKKQGLFSIVEGNRQTSSACNQCRYTDGEEYRMNKLSRVSTARNI